MPGRRTSWCSRSGPFGHSSRRARDAGNQVARQREEQRGREAVFGEGDGRFQDRVPPYPSVALVQRHPPVDRTGHGDGPDVATLGHVTVPFGAQSCRIGTGARSPHGQERDGRRRRSGNHGQDVAARSAQMGPDHGHHRRSRHDGVAGTAPLLEQGDARRTGQLVRGGDHPPHRDPRVERNRSDHEARLCPRGSSRPAANPAPSGPKAGSATALRPRWLSPDPDSDGCQPDPDTA